MANDKKINKCKLDHAISDDCGSQRKVFRANATTEKSDPLGTITNLHVIVAQQGIQGYGEKTTYDAVMARIELYRMQNNACHALSETLEKKKDNKTIRDENGNARRFYKFRVNHCLKRRIDSREGVYVYYNDARQKAQYGNLQVCGSVWHCPSCATKISEGRRLELKSSLEKWRSSGKFVYLITFTNPHHKGDDLEDLVAGQKKAFKKLWEKTSFVNHLKGMGYRGRIVSTEITWGEQNSWHPHYHCLFFIDDSINKDYFKNYLGKEWKIASVKAGLKEPTIKNGVDVSDGHHAYAYMTKGGLQQTNTKTTKGNWGLEHEMTKSHTKKGRNDRITPFDMLREMDDNPQYKHLFKEYANVFHGKQQLTYLPRGNAKRGIIGLKELLAVEETTDDELANKTDEQSVMVDTIAKELWQLILKAKKRAEYLHAVELDQHDHGNRVQELEAKLIAHSQPIIIESIVKNIKKSLDLSNLELQKKIDSLYDLKNCIGREKVLDALNQIEDIIDPKPVVSKSDPIVNEAQHISNILYKRTIY